MELDSYIDLYLTETQENLEVLNRCILELESEGLGTRLDEAFRAAHTIKGAASMMGFAEVAKLSHVLEDRLEELRAGTRALDREFIDELLETVDQIEVANSGVGTRAASSGGALLVRVDFEADCILKAARAAIVLRNAGQVTDVLATIPADLEEEFDGSLQLFVGAKSDRDALAEAIRRAGDVAAVEIEEALGAEVAAAIEGAARAVTADSPAESNGRGPDGVGATAATSARRFLRVDAEHISAFADGVADLGILCGRLEGVVGTGEDPALIELVQGVRRRISELEYTALSARMVPVGEVFHRFPRLVRDAARSLGKEIDFALEGQELEVDRRVLEEVSDALLHLLRNAIDHGIETPEEREAAGKARRGSLVLRALSERSSIRIEIEDDGRGIARERAVDRARTLGVTSGVGPATDEELLQLLSQPGLSTAGEVGDLSGRGVGLDVVVNRIRALGGAVTMRTEESRGTIFVLHLPISLTMTQSLRVRVGGEDYAIPLTHVAEVVELDSGSVRVAKGKEIFSLREAELPLVRLGSVLGVAEPEGERAAVVVEVAERRTAVAVDELVSREQIVVKEFVAAVGMLPIFTGATLLADGRPALVLDPVSVL